MFRQLGLPSLLAATLVVSACKSKSQEPAPASTPAPAPSTVTPVSMPAQPLPVTDDTLSLAQPEGGTCNWVRLEASRGTRRNLFSFAGGCELAHFAWSTDGSKGAVLQSFEDQRPPLAWTVDLATGQGTALPLPEVGRTTELGFGPEGWLIALVAHHDGPHMKAPERMEKDGQGAFVFESKQYPIEREGELGLAHGALRRPRGRGGHGRARHACGWSWAMLCERHWCGDVRPAGWGRQLRHQGSGPARSAGKFTRSRPLA